MTANIGLKLRYKMSLKDWVTIFWRVFNTVSGDTRTRTVMPDSNEQLPDFSIPISARPDLRETLQTVLDILQGSCPKGADISAALSSSNTKILVFSDQIMDQIAGIETEAAHGPLVNGNLICLRESALVDRSQHFSLIRQIAHEGTHVMQRQQYPHEFDNRLHQNYVANTLTFEREAFVNAAEINLAIMIQEAQSMGRASGQAVALRQTSMLQDWMTHDPYEAEANISAFENAFAMTQNLQRAIGAALAATIVYFEQEQAEGYRQKAIENQHLGPAP